MNFTPSHLSDADYGWWVTDKLAEYLPGGKTVQSVAQSARSYVTGSSPSTPASVATTAPPPAPVAPTPTPEPQSGKQGGGQDWVVPAVATVGALAVVGLLVVYYQKQQQQGQR